MPLSDHFQGGGVAAAIRDQLGVQTDLKKSRTLQGDRISKAASSDKAPRSKAFAAALEQYSRQLKNPGSVSAGEATQIKAELIAEGAAAGRGEVDMDALAATDRKLLTHADAQTPNPSGREKLHPRAFTGPSAETPQTSSPPARGQSPASAESVVQKIKTAITEKAKPVRKSSGSPADILIEKSADEVERPDGQIDAVQVLAKAQARLLDTWRDATGSDPSSSSSEYWAGYSDVLKAFDQWLKRNTQ